MTYQEEATSSIALDEIAVWEAFRALRLEGVAVHARLVRHMLERNVFAVPGDTLEIGGGDGELWRAGGEPFFGRALDAGAVHVTDSDPNLVEASRTLGLFRRDGVFVERADVERLPYSSQQFARAVALHVLHWCQTPERIARAIAEIARVLEPAGRAFVVTVDEQVHMVEVYRLMQRARAVLIEQGVRCDQEIPSASPRVLPFCAANAPAFLAAEFEHVRRIECEYAHHVEARHSSLDIPGDAFFVGYLRTLPFIKAAIEENRLPDELFDECASLFRAHIAAHGTFRMSRRDVIYDCSVPRAHGRAYR